jgi:hypothetical protein
MSIETPVAENIPTKLKQLFGFWPRKEQIEAISMLAVDQSDLIVIAPTG